MMDVSQMIIESATKIFEENCTKELIEEAENGAWAGSLWDILSETGMILAGIPEEAGGVGGSVRDTMNILRLAGKYAAPIPLADTMIGNLLLAELGQQAGDKPLAIALPKSADDGFKFTRSGDALVVSGKASGVPWARFAKKLLLIGTLDGSDVLAVVPAAYGKLQPGTNLAGEARDTVVFEEVSVNDAQVISIDDGQVTEKLMYSGALAHTVMMAGALERALELAVQYSQERTQFGRQLHRFQAVQHMLAQLAGEAIAASTAADSALDAYETDPLSWKIALAKIRVNEAAGNSAPIAHQIHGAIGFTYEHALHQTTRRLWSWRDEFGTEAQWGEKLASIWQETGQNGVWDFITK
jgi:acyl-CoA dehydrogenase